MRDQLMAELGAHHVRMIADAALEFKNSTLERLNSWEDGIPGQPEPIGRPDRNGTKSAPGASRRLSPVPDSQRPSGNQEQLVPPGQKGNSGHDGQSCQ
ncbi:hypothetical protein OESDEN_15851, partial [Oesophagostomum dentatum]